ncbi:NADH-ubiquinone oxidoreductase-F iron-sulfur binding region domain-containing protein [Candidatus Hydrogenedentota bacterium]
MQKLDDISALESLGQELGWKRDQYTHTVTMCTGTACRACGCMAVSEAMEVELAKQELGQSVFFRKTGCHGFCEQGPLIVIEPGNIFYHNVSEEDVKEIVSQTLVNGEIITRLLYTDPVTGNPVEKENEIPFYAAQKRVLLRDNQRISPSSIEEYMAIGGYTALCKALTSMSPQEIVDEVTNSGLRGRGGGGFPTGIKWASCRKAPGEVKYVICNADEGDPGAYANRSLLEGNPHSVIEGMIIGARAIGASEGYIYVRTEYPLAVELMRKAVNDAREMGLLGKNILGTGLDFSLKIDRGGGAFVCGESTALMASLEGRAGEPRAKHIHTVERGLWDMPSTLNNVETWSNIPLIINRGSDWFTKIGTGDVSGNPWGGSKGTKIFSLVGKVNNTGLVEVPMGITLREIVYDIGGGIRNDKTFKGVQTGGPSGGVLAKQHLDLPVDYDQLVDAGTMMGSGGMIVMDEDNCMVDFARFFVRFLEDESCGKCTPCREGLVQMGQILTKICEGKADERDVLILKELAEVIAEASLCQLGTTAPNPILTTLAYFRDEYDAHVHDRKCPAGVCKALVTYSIDAEKCTGCTLCAINCPADAVTGEKKQPHSISLGECTKCGICYDTCKFDAVLRY